MTLYREPKTREERNNATPVSVVPTTISQIEDAIVEMTRVAQRIIHAANLETARTEHITGHLLTGIHAGLRNAIKLGIGETSTTGPIIQCPICGRSEGHRYDCTYGM